MNGGTRLYGARSAALAACLIAALIGGTFAVRGAIASSGAGGYEPPTQPDPSARTPDLPTAPAEPATTPTPGTTPPSASGGRDLSDDTTAPAPPAATPARPAAPSRSPDPSARMPAGGGPGESWELAALLDDGSFLLTRFVITNAGPGDRNALATGLWIERDGTLHDFDNVRRKGEWSASDDRLRLDLGNSHLDLHAPFARYWVTKGRIQVDVQVPLDARVEAPSALAPKGSRYELLASGVTLLGSVKRKQWSEPRSLKGIATLSHSWTEEKAVPSRRITLQARADDGSEESVLLVHNLSRGARPYGWLVWLDSEGVRSAEEVSVATEGLLPGDRSADYPVPQRIVLSGPAEGIATLGSVLFERDLLGSFPQPLRTMVSLTLDQRPLRVWARSGIEVTLRPGSRGGSRRFVGEGATAIDFTDALH